MFRIRSWFKFRLRTLLIFITLIAIGMAVWGNRLYQEHREKLAVQAIKEAGGLIEKDKERAVRVYLGGGHWTDERIKSLVPHLRRLVHLRELDLVETSLTDQGTDPLAALGRLKELYVFETLMTEDGIKRLEQLLPQTNVKTEKPEPIASGMAATPIYPHAMVAVAWSPTSHWFASGSGDGFARLWSRDRLTPVAKWLAHSKWTFAIQFSPDGKTMATGGGDHVARIWDVGTQNLLAELTGHTDDIHALVFTPDGKRLVTASDDRTIRVWDLQHQRTERILRGHTAQIPQLDISPDGRRVASASRDGSVRVWELESGSQLAMLEPGTGHLLTAAFDPTGKQLAASGVSGDIHVWETDSFSQSRKLIAPDKPIYRLAFSRNSEQLAIAGDNGLYFWSEQHGFQSPSVKQEKVACVAFHPSDNLLASANADGELHLYDPTTLENRLILRTSYGERGLLIPAE